MALLAPQDGAALNAATLKVQALVAAFKPHPHRSFIFNGQEVAGVNAGRVSLVEIALDDAVVERVESPDCRRQLLVDSRLDLTGLADGPHTLTVTAFQGYHRARIGRSASIAFTLDRSLPLAEVNRVEEAATPAPFACFALRDDDDDDDERHGSHPGHADVHGRLVLGGQSDGIDPERDRVVIAAGSQIAVFEPGTLDCRERRNRSKCRFEDSAHPLVRRLVLEQKHGRLWKFRLRSGPLWPEDSVVYLRIGNDWGGIDLATGERLARLRQTLDTGRQGQAAIGASGGTIQTTDAAGVVIRLDVPAGALTQDTLITLTPLLTSPLPDSSTALHPGVKFEPEGLVFAEPATLTLDFSATGQTITEEHFVFLLTSPLTTLPLYGTVDPGAGTLTAVLSHFSTGQGGSGNSAQSDPAAWINAVLASSGNLTLSELRSLLSALALAQRLGVDRNIDMTLFSQRVQQSLDALASSTNCQADVANPSEAALQRWIDLERLGQSLGANTTAIRSCERQILQALIQRAGTTALTDQSDAALGRLVSLHETAQRLGFSELETQALEALAAGLRELLATASAVCSADAASGRAELERALRWAALVASVDPSLAADIQRAIDNCRGGGGGGGELGTIVAAMTSGSVETVTFEWKQESDGRYYRWSTGEGDETFLFGLCQGEEGDYPCSGSTGPPASMSLSGNQSDLTQPAPNKLVWNLSASNGSNDSVSVGYYGELTFDRAGTLTAEINSGWATQVGAKVGAAVHFSVVGTSYGYGLQHCFSSPGALCLGSYEAGYTTPGTVAQYTISGPQTWGLNLTYASGTGYYWGGQEEALDATSDGSGPLITITFTPSP